MFFEAVFVIWPLCAHIYTAKGSCKRITILGQPQASRVSKIPQYRLCSAKKLSCEVLGSEQFSQGDPGLCWGSFAFLTVDLTFHEEFVASHHVVIVLLGAGPILVLPLARMPLLKLYWQCATHVLPSCVCYLAHLSPHL